MSSGRLVRIGDAAAPLSSRIEAMRERLDAERAEKIERFGWALDVECADCGDAGVRPDGEPCLCRRGVRERTRRDEERERQAARDEWWRRTIPPRFQPYRLDGAPDRAAAAAVRTWTTDDPIEGNLFLHGPIGTGKTGLAIGAMWELGDRGMRPRFYGVPALLDQMRPGGDDDPMKRCLDARLLVLDDLGVEKPSDWVRERLYVLINGRYEACRPTIVTSNVDLPGLAAQIGERSVSRFAESVTVVKVAGPDRRRVTA
jgi:DNA replication protein DnaC